MQTSAALIAFYLLASAAPVAASCVPSFPYADGWLGGDRAYSIQLGSERGLWLFGDSFVRSDAQVSRSGSKMIYNAAAISTCHGDLWKIRYYYRKDPASGSPLPFFDTGTDQYRFWPLDGFVEKGTLYTFLVEVATTGTGLFDFREIGAKLAAIANPEDEPDRWKIKYRDLSSAPEFVPGVSAFVVDNFLYFYAVKDPGKEGKHEVILARIPVDHLHAPESSVEYFAKEGYWRKGLRQTDAEVVIEDAAPEFSVRYHPDIARWVMVETNPSFPPKQIGTRTAPQPEGPWSAFKPLYEIPEMQAPNADDVFCHEAREHPELSTSPNRLTVTYVCSSLSFGRQVDDLNLYRPRAISLPLR